MTEFDFIKTYIAGLPNEIRNHRDCSYILREGKSESEIDKFESEAGFLVPNELRRFYRFSYGAQLSEYQILSIPEIAEFLLEIQSTEAEFWKASILPFAFVRGVGDVVAFDLSKQSKDGLLLVLDGFHEIPPTQWKGICYGLVTWLTQMVESEFNPFWLK